ncbi:MAG: hypothetical protein L0Z62_11450 [Gemmataceae bacterium]|nr:hypothetical protein [Gemmataceae bacterium]
MRAVTAAVLRVRNQSGSAAMDAAAEAERAMAWLKQAVVAGFNDVALLRRDQDLTVLREREDFQKLLSELEAGKGKK